MLYPSYIEIARVHSIGVVVTAKRERSRTAWRGPGCRYENGENEPNFGGRSRQ